MFIRGKSRITGLMYDASPGFIRVTKMADIKVTKVDDVRVENFHVTKFMLFSVSEYP